MVIFSLHNPFGKSLSENYTVMRAWVEKVFHDILWGMSQISTGI